MSDQNNPFNVPAFRDELDKVFAKNLKPVRDLLEKHDRDIDRHEAILQRAKGARWAFGIIWAVATVLWEWLVHSGAHK